MADKDRVRVMKMEYPGEGGIQLDFMPTDANPNEDYPDVRGIVVQNDTSTDEDVYISRNANDDMIFADKVAGGPWTLTQLLNATGFDENTLLIDNAGDCIVNKNGMRLVAVTVVW